MIVIRTKPEVTTLNWKLGFQPTVFVHSLSPLKSDRNVYCHTGFLEIPEGTYMWMHVNNSHTITLRHLCIGGSLNSLIFPHNQLRCLKCGNTKSQYIFFKDPDNRITDALHRYTCELLACGTYTNKQVAQITGLGENTVKDIDKKRLQGLYTTNNGQKLIKPEKSARYLGIDEFKLHNGYRYTTNIIDLENGHILWIQSGKKKQVIYDFIKHVGMDWMDTAEAVVCDMNSDFQEPSKKSSLDTACF